MDNSGAVYISLLGNRVRKVVSDAPRISIKGNNIVITNDYSTPASTDNTDFGSTPVNTPVTKTFSILNTGATPLTLSGTPSISLTGTGCNMFSVTVAPASSVAAAGNTPFTLQYNPTAAGTHSCQVSIANNSTTTNPYKFAIQGTATTTTGTSTVTTCKDNPNPATYDTVTKILSIPAVDIPVIDPLTGRGTGKYALFNSTLQMLDGIEDLKIKTINYLNMLSTQDPSHATYDYFYDNTAFSSGGKLTVCVSVPQVIIIPPGIQVLTTPIRFEVVMQQLTLDNTVFHISSIRDASMP
ncbi:MAG: choice-of-anchor D domain-containing protein [Thiotrichaceae bacterium]|nr:choice-of-anchor D domain-containing protein [Thiotrichaceae bacterium]